MAGRAVLRHPRLCVPRLLPEPVRGAKEKGRDESREAWLFSGPLIVRSVCQMGLGTIRRALPRPMGSVNSFPCAALVDMVIIAN
jgi:hypothetical protein